MSGPELNGQIGTGTPGLDHVLRGGLPRGRVYLVSGPSGSGKTTLSLQFLTEGARNGEKTLYIGTSETSDEIRDIATSHGWDISGIEIRHFAGAEEVRPRQTMLHPVEIELPRAMEQIMGTIDQIQPARIVIDSLNEIRLLSREANWFRDQVTVLKQHIVGRDCTALLTDLRHDDQPILRSAVHGVIELEQFSPEYGPDRRRLRVAKVRGLAYRTGYHDVLICKGGLEVFPRLVAAEYCGGGIEGVVPSGIDELDAMLKGGLDRGTSTLFMGPTGTGKSTLVTQYAVAAARRGEKAALFIFDERIQTLFQRARSLGLELEEHVESGQVIVRQIDPAELTAGQFSHAVVKAVGDGVSLVVIDSLNGYSYAMPEERLLGVHLHELLSLLAQQSVTSLHVLTQHGILQQAPQPFDVSYIADTVLLLRPFEHRGEVRKAISVHKRRGGDHERTIREFELLEGRICVGKPLTQFTGVIAGHPEFVGDRLERPKGHP